MFKPVVYSNLKGTKVPSPGRITKGGKPSAPSAGGAKGSKVAGAAKAN